MPGFVEPRPDLIVPNPGGPNDPLGESVLDAAHDPLRVFEPRDRRLVIGRGQDPDRELHIAAAKADGVPIHRRATGGGAVLLAPGMLVIALRLPKLTLDADRWFAAINRVLIAVVRSAGGPVLEAQGHGDLALRSPTGALCKVLGASLRQAGEHAYYLGSLLLADHRAAMQRYLQSPSRQPAYRAGRGHDQFCAYVALPAQTVAAGLQAGLASADWPALHAQAGG